MINRKFLIKKLNQEIFTNKIRRNEKKYTINSNYISNDSCIVILKNLKHKELEKILKNIIK